MDFFELPIDRQIDLARRVAVQAIAHYGFPADATLELLKHRENSVFAVTHPHTGARGVLRVHRPGYHTAAAIVSEFEWMRALAAAGVNTPAAIATRDGALVVSARIPDLPEPRLCDLLEWIDGQPLPETDQVESFRQLGEIQARCHAHAAAWTPPAGFCRQAWDETALLDAGHPILAPAWEHWALTAAQRTLLLRCREALRARLRDWGKGADRYGLIHADLMPDNLIVAADGMRLIDFDDCGYGWRLYDPASALVFYAAQDIYPELVDAWATGYRRVRPLTGEDIAELPTFLLLRCFYGLGWLQTRRNSEAAQVFTEPLIALTGMLAEKFLAGS